MGNNGFFDEKLRAKRNRYFSVDFKKKRVTELENNLVSISDICKTYHVSRTSVYKWVYKYSAMAKKQVKQVVEPKSDTHKIQFLEQKVRELERLIGQKQVLIEFQEKMIEIAEDTYGIDIKKKLGSKLPGGSGLTAGGGTTIK